MVCLRVLMLVSLLLLTPTSAEAKLGKSKLKTNRYIDKTPPKCSRCVGGPPGAAGPPGPLGLQGIQGIQGVQGPQGVRGATGAPGVAGRNAIDGEQGPPGQKGQRGIPGKPGRRHMTTSDSVAFSVTMDTDMSKTSEYRVVKFNVVLANVGGHYDVTSGVFTTPKNGTYMVGFNGVSYDGQSTLLHLVRNSGRLLSAYDSAGCTCKGVARDKGSGGNVAILTLQRGDRLWVELPDQYGLHNAPFHNYATFYGYMLFPNL